jgi:hypothetical protein
VEASPRAELPKISSLLWKAYAAGQVAEDEAQALSDLIEARKALPVSPAPARRHVGSRPRSDASMERRRSWAAAGRLPPQLAARFSLGEQAVMGVIAAETTARGDCRLHLDHIAALAGVGRSTVKRAFRQAHALKLIRIEERRLTAWRNDSNLVRIVDPGWLSWLRLRRRRGVGSNLGPARIPEVRKGLPEGRSAKVGPASESVKRGDGGPREVRRTGSAGRDALRPSYHRSAATLDPAETSINTGRGRRATGSRRPAMNSTFD